MKAILSKGLAALAFVTILTMQSSAVDTDDYIKTAIKEECKRQGVEPYFPLAVAHVESRKIVRNKVVREFRSGLIGRGKKKYYAPFNIHPDYLHRRGWRVDVLEENIRLGVSRLKHGFKVLYTYNANCNKAYLNAIKQAMRRYQK